MPKIIDIEYCGGWGYGGPALRLKKKILESYPDIEINCHSASTMTSKIEVAWIDNGNKNIVWSKGRADTENGHDQIIANLKESQWFFLPQGEGMWSTHEGVPLKSRGPPNYLIHELQQYPLLYLSSNSLDTFSRSL